MRAENSTDPGLPQVAQAYKKRAEPSVKQMQNEQPTKHKKTTRNKQVVFSFYLELRSIGDSL